MVNFYPPISIDLLNTALQFVLNYVTKDKCHIILHAKKFHLFNDGEPWGKKVYSITMSSYDGAKSCELVGAYLLFKIKERDKNNFGLYRDDSLGISSAPPHHPMNYRSPSKPNKKNCKLP